MCHDLTWPPIPTKLPSDIPKFEGKTGEDPGDHVTTFHLWCSSKSLNNDSIHLILFQHPHRGHHEMVYRATKGDIQNF
jgi:hypothetical protein